MPLPTARPATFFTRERWIPMGQSAVITGQPARSIVEQATAGKFDFIVMGTHPRTGLSHALVGSVAERVVQKAPCAVVRETNAAALEHVAA